MGSVTPVVVPGEGYVRVEVNWADFPHTKKCWIYRRVAGVRTMLREGNAAPLSGGIAVAFDHEMPYDVPVAYQSVIALNANGDFEDGVTEWLDTTNSGTIGTVEWTRDYYVPGEGVASAKLTPDGSSSTAQAVSEFIPATAGVNYSVSGRVMLSSYWSGGVGLRLAFYNGVTLLSTLGAYNDTTPAPGEFGSYSFTATAPATTTQMRVMGGLAGTPPVALKAYLDEIYVTTSGTNITAADVVVPSDGAGWWVDPLHPATKIKLRTDLQASGCVPDSAIGLLGIAPETFPADEEALPVNNAATPIGAWQVRKAGQATMQVVTITLADLAQLKSLHASGAPLLLQLPTAYGEDAAYQLHAELEVSRLAADMRKPWRVIRSSFVKVVPPVGPAEGTWKTRYQDFTKITTFWQATSQNGGAWDQYGRSVGAGSLGSSNTGQTYALTGTATDYSVNGSAAVVALSALNSIRRAVMALGIADFDILATSLGISATPTGANAVEQGITARYVDASNFVEARIFRGLTTITAALRQMVGGVETVTSFPVVTGAAANAAVSMRFVGKGTSLSLWVGVGTATPSTPTVVQTVTHVAAGGVGLFGIAETGITNTLPISLTFDELLVANLAVNGAATWLDGLQGELVAP